MITASNSSAHDVAAAGGVSWPAVVCPLDGGLLDTDASHLACAGGHLWDVIAGIPRMIPSAGNYADAFGLQWQTYRKTQLDSYTRTTLSRDRARRCVGAETWRILQERPVNVLEVGCGAGRFTEVLLATQALVTSVDYSSAVDANQQSFPQTERHRIFQADVRQLPFMPGQFDLVFCLGVIQHTPDPEQTIRKLYEQVRPGGSLVIDHYTWSLSEVTKSATLVRMVLSRTRPESGLRWSRRIVNAFLPLHKAARHSRIAQALLSRVSPVLSYYQTLPLSDELQREWALLDTHDSLTDRYKRFRTKGQILRTLTELGAERIWCEYGGNGVEARCRRPVR